MSDDNIVDINDAKKKRKSLILFKTTKTEETFQDNYELSYKSCFTCLHHRELAKGVGQCGHFPSASFHEVTTMTCLYNNGKPLWYPKVTVKSYWKRFKEKWFK